MLPKILRSLSPIALVAAAFNFVAPATLVAQATSSLVTTRLTQPIDENARVTLKGTVHPLASAANFHGVAPDSMPLDRVQVVLKRSDAQESALKQLISDLHTPGSASYHKWLTPDAFGKQFGPSDQDVATLEAWLQSKGFSITKLNPGKQTLEISGNVSQFREAFHTQINKYLVNGETHYANSTDPQIPAALAPVFGGFTSLSNFRGKNFVKVLGKATYDPKTGRATPLWTTGPGTPAYANNYVVAPGDFGVQYDLPNAALNSKYTGTTYDGTGQTIAIVNDSNINMYLVQQFRSLFKLDANPAAPNLPQVIIDGNDPGVDGINDPDGPNGDSVEAYIDVEEAGAVAPKATVDLVIASDTALQYGLFLAAEHAVYGNIAPVISMSFGLCEAQAPSLTTAFGVLWEQAAAQGITVMVSSGDAGSAQCDSDAAYAVNGQAVTGWGESPYNVSVGGTDFYYSSWNSGSTTAINTQLGTYWNTTPSNNSAAVSIQGYIPEQPWNNSQYGLNIFSYYDSTGTTIVAGGAGGASNCATFTSAGACAAGYPKPTWQKGTGVPADSVRDIPDVSLFAANGLNASFYPECYQDGDCQPVSSGGTVQITGLGGTSISSPAFAGIMALVNQATGSRQGQADFVLYPLATQFPAAFHDVTNGTNSEPCSFSPLSTDCISVTNPITIADPNSGASILEGQIGTGTTAEYNAGVGYDLASGLGSVDASVLVSDWNKVTFISSTVTLTPSETSFAHGTAITVSGSVTPTSGTATGNVALMTDSTEPVQQGQTLFTLSGSGNFGPTSVSNLPGGTYNIWGQYSGDGTNAASTSQKTSITVNPENSGIYFNLLSPAGNVSGVTNVDYGTQILLSAQVTPSSQLSNVEKCQTTSGVTCPVYGFPTGTVAFVDSGTTINTAVLNTEGDAEYNAPFSVGTHSVAATYAGDNSYNKSTASAVNFTVQKDTPQIFISAANQDGNGDYITGQATVFNIEVLNGAASNSATNTSVFPVPIAPPTGTITVSGLPGGSQTATLSALVDPAVQGAAAIATVTIPASTSSGTPTITIKYPGDSNYNSTSVNGQISIVSTSGLASTTTANVTGSISPSTSITIAGTVTGQSGHPAPTGTVFVYSSGNLSASSGAPLPAATLIAGSSDVSTFSLTLNSQSLVQGTNFVTLQYTGDNNYKPSAYQLSTAVSSPLSDFSMVPETTIVPVAAGHSSTDTLNLSSVNSFVGAVSFTCSPASGISCTITPSATLTSGSTSPLTLTINASASATNTNYNVLVTGKDSTGLYVHTLAIEAVVTGGSTTPGFSLGAAPSSLNLIAGASTGNTSVVTATPANGFTGTINLSCSVAGPSGATSPATCSLSSSSVDVSSGAATSTLTVASTSTTTAGAYTVTITGTGTSTSASTPISETTTVTVAITAPTFALSANPNSGTITAGSSATTSISVAPSGFTGNVALTCAVAGSGTGVACSLSPTSVSISGTTAGTSTLTVTTSSNSAALSHPLNKFFAVGGGIAVAGLLFFGIPARRRSWRAILGMLLFGAIVGIGIGCGGNGNGGGGGGSSANYTVTVTGTAGSITQTATVAITVNSQ
jgi:subtilase family serine protease